MTTNKQEAEMATTTKVKAKATKTKGPIPLPGSVVGLLNRGQVAEALGGISVRKLNMMIARGTFPPATLKLGGSDRCPRWSVGVVNAWCDTVARRGYIEDPT